MKTASTSPTAKRSDAHVAAAAPDAEGGRYVTYIDSKRLGPNTPVRRCKRFTDGKETPWELKLPHKSPTPNKTYRTIGTSAGPFGTTTPSVASVGTSTTADNDDDGIDDLCATFSAKVKFDGSDLTEVRLTGTPTRVSPMPKEGRFIDLVQTNCVSNKKRAKSSSPSNGVIGTYTPVKRCARNA